MLLRIIYSQLLDQLAFALKVNGPLYQQRERIFTSTNPNTPGLPEQPYHAFLAGAVGGYIVSGRYSGVNYQLLLYLTSCILVVCVKLASEKNIPPFSWKRLSFTNTYPWAAAGIWGTVMMLFEEYPNVSGRLQENLQLISQGLILLTL